MKRMKLSPSKLGHSVFWVILLAVLLVTTLLMCFRVISVADFNLVFLTSFGFGPLFFIVGPAEAMVLGIVFQLSWDRDLEPWLNSLGTIMSAVLTVISVVVNAIPLAALIAWMTSSLYRRYVSLRPLSDADVDSDSPIDIVETK